MKWLEELFDSEKRKGIIIGLGIAIFLIGFPQLFLNTDFSIRYNQQQDRLMFNQTEAIVPFVGADEKPDYFYYLKIKEIDSPCIIEMDVKFRERGTATLRNYCEGDYLELDYHSLYIDKIIIEKENPEINIMLYKKKKVGFKYILTVAGALLIILGNIREIFKKKEKKKKAKKAT